MADPERNTLITDGEGPLVFKDLARDISRKLVIERDGQRLDGQQFFDTLSMFNAFIYEMHLRPTQPGDTLAFLVPHLLTHGISDEDLFDEAHETTLATGAQEYIHGLKADGWKIQVISSAYSHLWDTVGIRFDLGHRDIASTHLELDQLIEIWTDDLIVSTLKIEESLLSKKSAIEQAQSDIRRGLPLESVFLENNDMMEIYKTLDSFYFEELPKLGFNPLNRVNVVGGKRKIEAIKEINPQCVMDPEKAVYVGDSITDDATFKFLLENGGLPIAVNGDLYALRNARVAVATTDMRHVRPILDAFVFGGVEGAISFAESANQTNGKERTASSESRVIIHVLTEGQNMTEILEIHDRFRKEIRGNSTPLI